MDRRKSLKLIVTGAVAVPAVIAGCKTDDKKKANQVNDPKFTIDRNPDELKYEKELLAKEKFFTDHEIATITLLADMPTHQVPMKGGLRWLDVYCLKQYEKAFIDCSSTQQIELVDQIAYPKKAKPEMSQGVKFFSLMRDLTASGFYTSEIGVKDIGYVGNTPTQWNGVPEEVLQQYKIAYTEKELNECVSFTKP